MSAAARAGCPPRWPCAWRNAIAAARRSLVVVVSELAVPAFAAAPADNARDAAARSSGYVLDWDSVDGGTPQTGSSATFRVRGSVGQPDVGSVSGGVFRIDGGFWSSTAVLGGGDGLFSDGFEAAP